MTTFIDPAFRDSLLKKPQDRTAQDLTLVNANLKTLEALSCLRDTTIRSLCKTVRYVKHESNDVLYKNGDLITCWYILLSGSVFIDGSMFLPRSGFGRRTAGQLYRIHDCLVLETSEMLVIDYPSSVKSSNKASTMTTSERESFYSHLSADEATLSTHDALLLTSLTLNDSNSPLLQPPLLMDTSGLHTANTSLNILDLDGADIHMDKSTQAHAIMSTNLTTSMISHSSSSTQNGLNSNTTNSCTSHSVNANGDDVSVSSEQSIQVKDLVRECLEKDPKERIEEDIDILFEFMQHFPAFTELTQPIIKQLCACMVLGVVEKAHTVVLDHNEKLDSYAVVLNGLVERTLSDGTTKIYHVGNHFGVEATLDTVYHEGVMRTKCDDCQFVLIKQTDYYEILNKSKENINRLMENGILVMVTEQRALSNDNSGHIILRASVDKLVDNLMQADDNSSLVDPCYIEDFLLTYRTFIECPTYITTKLFDIFQTSDSHTSKIKVYRIILLWITNHFNDFEINTELYEFIEQFQELLLNEKMFTELRMITIAISTKSKPRLITLARSKRDETLPFSIQGGWDKGYGIFISKIDKDSKAHELGLRKCDQIIEVNGQLFQHLPYTKALETIKSYTHLSIKVKYNPMSFNEMLLHPEKSPYRNKKHLPVATTTTNISTTPRSKSKEPTGRLQIQLPQPPPPPVAPSQYQAQSSQSQPKSTTHRFRKALDKLNKISKKELSIHVANEHSIPSLKSITRSPSPCPPPPPPLPISNTNHVEHEKENQVDHHPLSYDDSYASEHVLKIFKNDQTFKYLVVLKETCTKEVVMLSLNEFNIMDEVGSGAYSLCEVSVDQDKVIKQKRLPDQMINLAERLGLNARYYLKSNHSSEQFLSDPFSVEELIRDANITFLQLDPIEISAQLTLRDYCLFKAIESSEYIDYLYKKKSRYGCEQLKKFADLSNEEMFWVIHEILHESNIQKRAKIIKHFIHIAKICKECKNFNSLLAILSGLDHVTVTRLKDTWDKVSPKYKKILQDLKALLDPSRNMLKYRTLLKSDLIQPPIIPFFPLCQKDLTFIKEPNDSIVEGLINFDKLRKLSKNIRSVVQMTSSSFDLTSLLEVPTSHSVIFAMFGCVNPLLTQGSRLYMQMTKLNMRTDHIKKLYEESVMVRKVRHYLSNISKHIETNEDRLRIISSTLEHSGSGNTLRRKPPSPNSSIGGSLSSINALNNSSNLSNGSLNERKISSQVHASLFGTHSPCAVKKLLSLSETKVKTVKTSNTSSGVCAPQIHGKFLTTTSSTSIVSSSNGQLSPVHSPKTQKRSTSSSQTLNKYPYMVPLSSESSSVSTIKPMLVANLSQDGDSGRASMASNIDQEQQYSPIFPHSHHPHDHSRPAVFYNKISNNTSNEMHLNPKIHHKYSSNTNKQQQFVHSKLKKSKSQNEVYYCQDSLEEEDDDQISAV